METLRLQRCTEKDLSQLQRLAVRTFKVAFEAANHPKDFQEYLDHAFSEERLRKALRNPGSQFYFVYNQGQLLAYFQVNTWTAQSDLHIKGSLELERIYVVKEAQGKGVGKWILNGVRKLARAKGCDSIWLGVWEKNPRAIAFYLREGFRKFGEHPYYIGTDRQTDWLMRTELTNP